MDLRRRRKLEHISWATSLADGPTRPGFTDVHLLHNCLPESGLRDIDYTTSFCGRPLGSPLIFDAITGGTAEVARINAALARVARRYNLGMAVGSQTAALDDLSVAGSFSIVRQEHPDGFIMANVSAGAAPEAAVRAVEMLNADALQVHLNAAQELMMPEGEADFRGWLDNVAAVIAAVGVPVVVKEVGFGIAREEARLLAEIGAQAINVAGRGGTNFIMIEGMRGGDPVTRTMADWGIPTVCSLVELHRELGDRVQLTASGGIRSGIDAAKALALGATTVGMAGPLVRALVTEDEEALADLVGDWHRELALAMVLTGSRTVSRLKKRSVVITGQTASWLSARGIDPGELASRDPRTGA